ncbi:MAG: hypothetical protein WBM44_10685 [Waterburya sp.]
MSDYGERTIFIGFGGLRDTRFPPYNLIDCAIVVGKCDRSCRVRSLKPPLLPH